MRTRADLGQFEVLCVIINFGLGSKVLHIARENGVPGGTVFLGRGTVRNRILELLELHDVRKEIIVMITEQSCGDQALQQIHERLKLHKPNRGIAFTMPLAAFLGSGDYEFECDFESGGAPQTMYNAIFTIVDKGRGESVMTAANKAGAQGGTIINARGAGAHETSKVFKMDIEPEKEVVLILARCHLTEGIVRTIRDDLNLAQPGNGIIFVQDVRETYGIHE